MLTGKVIEIFPTVEVSDKFKKREFVVLVSENPQYPQEILLQLTQDKVSLIDGVKKGDTLTISYNLRGRSWTSPQGEKRWFNSLEAWKVEKVAAAPAPMPIQVSGKQDDIDDLPF